MRSLVEREAARDTHKNAGGEHRLQAGSFRAARRAVAASRPRVMADQGVGIIPMSSIEL
jgi:hypothetical protein